MQLLSAVNSQGVLLDIKVSAQEILHKTEGSKIVSICELLLRLPFFFFLIYQAQQKLAYLEARRS